MAWHRNGDHTFNGVPCISSSSCFWRSGYSPLNSLSRCFCCVCFRAKNQNVDLPAVLVFPSWQTDTYPSVVALPSSAEKLIVHIKTALLHPVVNHSECIVAT